MTLFLVRRLLSMVPTIIGITVLAFAILNMMPTDPLVAWSSGETLSSAEAFERLRDGLGAERSAVRRYLDWGLTLLQGDLGRSLRDGRPVGEIISDALPWTLLLNLCSVAVIYGAAVPFGLFGSSAPGSPADRAGGFLLLALYAVPSFAAALLLQQLFAVKLGILPLQGVGDPAAGSSTLLKAADVMRHLALPTICLAFSGWAFVARYCRAAFRSTLGREFLSVARAKGLSRLRAQTHIVASAAVPLVTLLAAIIPGLVGGSVIVEQVFSWPGIGRLYLSAVEGRDYPVVLGLTLLSALLVLAANIVVDLLYLLVDPRIREGLLEGDGDAH